MVRLLNKKRRKIDLRYKKDPKNIRITICLTPTQRDEFDDAAESEGMQRGTWIRRTLMKAAKKALRAYKKKAAQEDVDLEEEDD